MRRIFPALLFILFGITTYGQQFTRQDTLRGTLTADRAWWDVTFYDLNVRINPTEKSIEGTNVISYRVIKPSRRMQIDLQSPLILDKAVQNGQELAVTKDGNAWFITLKATQAANSIQQLTLTYHGVPREAKRAPWDGGIVWGKDSLGRPWIATACQGLGASVWWPNKDHQTEEPDSMRIRVTVPAGLNNVSNGRLKHEETNSDNTVTTTWYVSNPINNYDVALNIGHYKHFSDKYQGEKGPLDLDYWVLDYNLDRARTHFEVVKPMMKCFEHWFGPYPFYEDSYKLVETPHLGMEHQSAVAYGNQYKMGYRGTDLSGTGWGLKWDFIIIHESGHEWFGNNITTKDIGDMWVHESFTNYSETIFLGCEYGKDAANAYVQGIRSKIANDKPIIGQYGVNEEGSGDMYPKGSNMLHTIRQIIDNDETFRKILRGLNKTFYHKTVTTAEVEQYINKNSGKNFDKVFDQYLRRKDPPVFEYSLEGNQLRYRWVAEVKGFDMPLKVDLGDGKEQFIQPGTEWKTIAVKDAAKFAVDKNFYVKIRKV
ncbi:M1 family metallopeptidase [Chitinophaga barathri]|uniref:M1 family peptidase n=1 Tax=Chitinophaga barathri TaxID=1647451 RepID=A0A3N4MCT8_9BACT|nr:M1 family metallopeptidase [Chitinophaga barathri]RPD39726.1 M1 family peptidase [Chitinophaga barathri]